MQAALGLRQLIDVRTLLLVTHDRRLLDQVRLDQRWQVKDGHVTTGGS